MSGLSNSEMSAFDWRQARGCDTQEHYIEHERSGPSGPDRPAGAAVGAALRAGRARGLGLEAPGAAPHKR